MGFSVGNGSYATSRSFSVLSWQQSRGAGLWGGVGFGTAEWLWAWSGFHPSSYTLLCALANVLTETSVHLKWGNYSCYQEVVAKSEWLTEYEVSRVPSSIEQLINVHNPDSPSISDHQLQVDLSWGSIQQGSGLANFLCLEGRGLLSPVADIGTPWRYCCQITTIKQVTHWESNEFFCFPVHIKIMFLLFAIY